MGLTIDYFNGYMSSSFSSMATIIFYLLWAIPMYKLAIKAEVRNPWLAFVPVMQIVLFLHIIDRSALYIFVLMIPFVGVIVLMYFQYQLLISFDIDQGLAIISVITGIIYIIIILYLAFSSDSRYVGEHSYRVY